MNKQTHHLPTPVLVVEDDVPMQNRLRQLLQSMGYAQEALVFCQTLAAAHACIAQDAHALVLVDLGLPDGNGITLIAALRQADAEVPILVISAWSAEEAILAALQAGASGYILKERDDVEVMLSIRSVLRGGAPIDPFMARRILKQLAAPPTVSKHVHTESDIDNATDATPTLTPREYDVLQLVAQGLSNREIAEHVALSHYTVEGHIKVIYQKLAVSNRTKAVHAARAMGLLK